MKQLWLREKGKKKCTDGASAINPLCEHHRMFAGSITSTRALKRPRDKPSLFSSQPSGHARRLRLNSIDEGGGLTKNANRLNKTCFIHRAIKTGVVRILGVGLYSQVLCKRTTEEEQSVCTSRR